MTGYFSRLIQQTGIALDTTGDVHPRVDQPDTVGFQPSGGLEPVSLEDSQVMTRQPEQIANSISQVSREDAAGQPQVAKSDEFHSPADASRDETGQITNLSPATREIEQPSNPTEPELTELESGIQLSSEEVHPQHTDILVREASEQGATANRSTSHGRDTQPSVEVSGWKRRVEQGKIGSQPPASPKEGDLSQPRQAYLQAVREWVAGAPVVAQAEQESHFDINPFRQEMLLERQNPKQLVTSINKTPLAPLFLETIDQQAAQKLKNQDFVLSIGTISLVVEAPQQQVHRPQAPPPKPERTFRTDNQASRLNRHYLRLT